MPIFYGHCCFRRLYYLRRFIFTPNGKYYISNLMNDSFQNTPMNKNKLKVGFTGDVMLGRGVNQYMSRRGFDYPWGNLLPLLKSTDINIINLETTLTTSPKQVYKVFNFKATPDKIKALTDAQVTIANLANNHILDFSEAGMMETISILEEAGIQHVGAGINDAAARQPALVIRKNIRLGIIGITDNEPGWKAGPERSGISYINILAAKDREQVLMDIQELRKKVDVLVVSIHWGPNMEEEPSSPFVDFAHHLIDQGADIIHGHSAHIFQSIEIYKRKLILYDTGDFVDDYVVDPVLRNDHSFFYITEISKNGVERLQLIPVLIRNYQVNRAEDDHFRWSIRRMQQLCVRFNTKVNDDGEVLLPSIN
jgi:poly-gamma-glutamate capsule biosynthesis protein CapA/YwtB (metallophosphatase superfamily)